MFDVLLSEKKYENRRDIILAEKAKYQEYIDAIRRMEERAALEQKNSAERFEW